MVSSVLTMDRIFIFRFSNLKVFLQRETKIVYQVFCPLEYSKRQTGRILQSFAIEYEGKFDNGEVFDSSTHDDHTHPLEFVVGEGMVISGFDQAVLGMEESEEKNFQISLEEGYGKYASRLKQFPATLFAAY